MRQLGVAALCGRAASRPFHPSSASVLRRTQELRRHWGHWIQKRCVGTKYLAKVALANEKWAAQARKISQGEGEYFWDFLEERGFIKDVLGKRENLRHLLNIKRVPAYVGIDPTADSLHLGHLVAMMPIFHMYLRGYPAYTLLGATTAKVGDPTGRLAPREQESSEVYRTNLFKMHYQTKLLWSNVEQLARLVLSWERVWESKRGIENNGVWWNKQPLHEILKYLGTDLRMGPLMSRDLVKTRLESSGGMAFSEFIYPIMQAWDWWTLWRRLGVQLQVGGSDQFGNIVTGADIFKIVRKNEPDPQEKYPEGLLNDPVGFTVPLLTDSSGSKLGKSAGNAIWLDPFKLSSYDLYGWFLRQSDDKVESLLKLLTFMPTEAIKKLVATHMKAPEKRLAHHNLAWHVVCLSHSIISANKAQKEHVSRHANTDVDIDILRPSGTPSFKAEEAAEYQQDGLDGSPVTMQNRPRMDMELPFDVLKESVPRLFAITGLVSSLSEGNRLARAAGAYIGGKPGQKSFEKASMPSSQIHWTPIKNWFPEDTKNFIVDNTYLYLRKGKNNIRVIRLIDNEEWKKSGRTYEGQRKTGELRSLGQKLKAAKAELRAQNLSGGAMGPAGEGVKKLRDSLAEDDEEEDPASKGEWNKFEGLITPVKHWGGGEGGTRKVDRGNITFPPRSQKEREVLRIGNKMREMQGKISQSVWEKPSGIKRLSFPRREGDEGRTKGGTGGSGFE